MLSKTASHALRAVTLLAELPRGSFLGASELAERINAPRNYLGKLLKQLGEVGLLESQKGKGGGFRLAKNAKWLSVFDVIEPIDAVSRWEGCFLGLGRCSAEQSCAVHDQWAAVRERYLEFLHNTTIAELAAPSRAPACQPPEA